MNKKGETFYLVRGGSWDDDPDDCYSAFRNIFVHHFDYTYMTFRLVRKLNESQEKK